MPRDKIEHIPVGQLRPWTRNARTHSKKQIRQLANSIQEFGFINPVLVDSEDNILAGHARVAAAKLRGFDTVPCLRIEDMTPAQKRAYVLADNKLALNAGWDEQILGEELQALIALDPEFDIDILGFDTHEIDNLIEGLGAQEAGDPKDERLPAISKGPAVSQPGDLWLLGCHRLICANALEQATYDILLAGELAQMVFTDPPYNVPIAGHVGGSGAIQHPEFLMASGEMSTEQFTDFLGTATRLLAEHSADGSIHFLCMDFRHLQEILTAGRAAYTELKNLIVWAKDVGGMGTFYRSRHELILAYKNGTAPHINNFELGQHGRYRTNLWEYRGANSFKAGRMEELALHPTVKPVQMIADAIKDVSHRDGIVLDVFGGSGSTLIAAHKTGRRGYLVELDPTYVDRTIRRWQTYAHDDAILAATGETFDAVARQRRGASRQPPQALPSTDQGDHASAGAAAEGGCHES
ncbi:MAG: site-specific DNA-methyltransferase [Hyphomicrobiaceae bacterium]|uniref:site-specific DNA-methyltransferase n=1 Tax=Pseudorhodoplanes sp. TaxID=1934341 RepID=UPI003D0BAD70